MNKKEIGCTQCPYAGHIELKECPDAYTDISKHCGLYNHHPIEQRDSEDCMEEDAKQASIPYTYNAPQHDWKCGYPDMKGGAEND